MDSKWPRVSRRHPGSVSDDSLDAASGGYHIVSRIAVEPDWRLLVSIPVCKHGLICGFSHFECNAAAGTFLQTLLQNNFLL